MIKTLAGEALTAFIMWFFSMCALAIALMMCFGDTFLDRHEAGMHLVFVISFWVFFALWILNCACIIFAYFKDPAEYALMKQDSDQIINHTAKVAVFAHRIDHS